jgi:putative sterol carrier protein
MTQMRASRAVVRRAIAGLGDEEMDKRVFIPLVGCGWVTARFALQSCLVHTWAHFTEARLRLKQTAPLPNPAITYTALNFFLGMMPMMVNAEQAKKVTLLASLNVGGAGGGHWTVRVGNGACKVTEERVVTADLVMNYHDAETFLATMRAMQNPMIAMLTGRIKIQGFHKMGLFGKLFAEPKPNQVLEPIFA